MNSGEVGVMDPVAFYVEAEQRLTEIRQISNVMQALQNVINQCDSIPDFRVTLEMAEAHLERAQRELQKRIHQS